jgi:hypothetical protein
VQIAERNYVGMLTLPPSKRSGFYPDEAGEGSPFAVGIPRLRSG